MKYGILALGVALGIVLVVGVIVPACHRAATAALTEDARLALDVRCGAPDSPAARECRTRLTKLYLAGSLDPDKTLRAYCESVKTARWGGSRPAPPKLCLERYGGWRQG